MPCLLNQQWLNSEGSKFVKLIMQAWSFLYKEFHSGLIDTLKPLDLRLAKLALITQILRTLLWSVGLNRSIMKNFMKHVTRAQNTLNSDENALLSIWLSGILP